jgi:hypothetical protein
MTMGDYPDSESSMLFGRRLHDNAVNNDDSKELGMQYVKEGNQMARGDC